MTITENSTVQALAKRTASTLSTLSCLCMLLLDCYCIDV